MRVSRKHAFAAPALAGALALAVAGVAVGAESSGTASESGVNQTLSVEVSKTKVVKKAQKGVPATPVALTIGVAVDTDGGTRPPAAKQVDIGIGEKDEFIFDLTGLKKCKASQLEDTTTADAEKACKGAQVGKGESAAMCSGAPDGPGASFPGTVRAFNGGKKGKNKLLLLHASTEFPTGPVATVLVGKLTKKNVLKVPVEVLGEGSCGITDFFAAIRSQVKVQGEKHSYVAAACPDKKWKFPGRFQYYDNPYGVTELKPKASLKCKGKS